MSGFEDILDLLKSMGGTSPPYDPREPWLRAEMPIGPGRQITTTPARKLLDYVANPEVIPSTELAKKIADADPSNLSKAIQAANAVLTDSRLNFAKNVGEGDISNFRTVTERMRKSLDSVRETIANHAQWFDEFMTKQFGPDWTSKNGPK